MEYIEAPRPELYHIPSDPGESQVWRLLTRRWSRASARRWGEGRTSPRRRCRARRRRGTAQPGLMRRVRRDPRRRLEAFDPRDRIVEWSEIEHGVDLIDRRDRAGSKQAFTRARRSLIRRTLWP